MDSIDLTSLGAGLAAGAALATCLGLGGGKPAGPSGFGELVGIRMQVFFGVGGGGHTRDLRLACIQALRGICGSVL